jgi:hypothetical protein
VSAHDSPVAGGRHAAVRDREDAVVARLEALGTAFADVGPDPDFRAATRARLVAMAAVRTPPPAPRPGWRRLLDTRADAAPRPAWRRRLTGGLAAAALAVTALATLIAVSTDARPGDVLYGLKRGTEQTQLALAGDERGQTLLDFAATRLAELGALRGGDASDAVSTLRTMDEQTTEGAAWLAARAVQTRSTDPLRDLSLWTAQQQQGLAALHLPSGAQAAGTASRELLARIGDRVTTLSAAIGCPAGPATQGSDALGPKPAACAPAPTAGADQGRTVTGGSGTTTSVVPPAPAVPTTVPPGTSSSSAANGGGTQSVGGPGSLVPSLPTTTLPPVIKLPLPTLGTGSGTSPTSGAGSGGSLGICIPQLLQLGSC